MKFSFQNIENLYIGLVFYSLLITAFLLKTLSLITFLSNVFIGI